MSKELYFVSDLVAALRGPNFAPELVATFGRIDRKGQEPGFERGHTQFRRFMALSACYAAEHRATTPPVNYGLIVDALTKWSAEPTAVSHHINCYPHWREAFDDLRRQMVGSERSSCIIGIALRNQAGVVLQSTMSREARDHQIEHVLPGHYRLLLDTGEVLWERDLTRSHLAWCEAFPSAPLSLAADTQETVGITPVPTLNVELFNRHISIRVWPGPDAGRIELHVDAIDEEPHDEH